MIRLDWTITSHKPGTDYPIFKDNKDFQARLRTTASQKTQYGKCHLGGTLKNLIEEMRKYYMGFNYRPSCFYAYSSWDRFNMYRRLSNNDLTTRIAA